MIRLPLQVFASSVPDIWDEFVNSKFEKIETAEQDVIVVSLRYDIIYSVVAPNLATERGCLHVRNHIFSCVRTGKCSWLLHLQMVRRRRQRQLT